MECYFFLVYTVFVYNKLSSGVYRYTSATSLFVSYLSRIFECNKIFSGLHCI